MAAVLRRAAAGCSRTLFSASRALRKDLLVSVPGMGDSITEGTLIKQVAPLGAFVALDAVVTVIETDKVRPAPVHGGGGEGGARTRHRHSPKTAATHCRLSTRQVSVDVRAPHAGVLKAYHAGLNDTVAVGAALFTLDTAATAGAAAPAPAAGAAPAKAAPPPPQQQQQQQPAAAAAAAAPASAAQLLHPQQQLGRKPSIHFRYGVRPAAGAGAGAGSSGASSHAGSAAGDYAASLAALYPSKPGALPELSRLPSFGRPPLSADEEQRIYSGGAYGFVPPPPEKKAARK